MDLLTENGMTACKPNETSIDPNHRFTNMSDRLIDAERYQSLVGRLIYLTFTKPDITYAMSVVNQFMYAPATVHLDANKRSLSGYCTFIAHYSAKAEFQSMVELLSKIGFPFTSPMCLYCDNNIALALHII